MTIKYDLTTLPLPLNYQMKTDLTPPPPIITTINAHNNEI